MQLNASRREIAVLLVAVIWGAAILIFETHRLTNMWWERNFEKLALKHGYLIDIATVPQDEGMQALCTQGTCATGFIDSRLLRKADKLPENTSAAAIP